MSVAARDTMNFANAILEFVHQYGYLALLAFAFLESSMLFPFAPSELVVPAAAGILVQGPLSFALFVAAATVGATLGGLVPYLLGREGHEAVDRYGRYVRVSDDEVDRGVRWFRRWGETAVFWGRLLPVLRSIISIPAGFAEMDRWRFLAYTAGGAALFNAIVAALVFFGRDELLHALPT